MRWGHIIWVTCYMIGDVIARPSSHGKNPRSSTPSFQSSGAIWGLVTSTFPNSSPRRVPPTITLLPPIRTTPVYCLNAISFGNAWANHRTNDCVRWKNIQTWSLCVMVSSVEPPLSICRIQCLDFRDCVPGEQHEPRYAAQFDKLLDAIDHARLDF